MILLIAKRVYKGELVDLFTASMSRMVAFRKLKEITAFPGASLLHTDGGEGELWFEIEKWDVNGQEILSDPPVCFPANIARDTLLRTGASEVTVDERMTDEYAESFLLTQRLLQEIVEEEKQ